MEERGHATSVEACEVLVEPLLGRADLNYMGHQSCVKKDRIGERKAREREALAVLVDRKA